MRLSDLSRAMQLVPVTREKMTRGSKKYLEALSKGQESSHIKGGAPTADDRGEHAGVPAATCYGLGSCPLLHLHTVPALLCIILHTLLLELDERTQCSC